MKRDHRLTSLTLALLVVAFSGTTSFTRAADTSTKLSPQPAAGGKPGNVHSGFRRHRCEASVKLNLTPEQKEKMKAANQTFREQNAATIADLKAKREQLRNLGTDPAHEAERQQLREQVREVRSSLRIRHKAAMQGILTPEQESRLQALKQECKAKCPKGQGTGFGPKKGSGESGSGEPGYEGPEGTDSDGPDKAPF